VDVTKKGKGIPGKLVEKMTSFSRIRERRWKRGVPKKETISGQPPIAKKESSIARDRFDQSWPIEKRREREKNQIREKEQIAQILGKEDSRRAEGSNSDSDVPVKKKKKITGRCDSSLKGGKKRF